MIWTAVRSLSQQLRGVRRDPHFRSSIMVRIPRKFWLEPNATCMPFAELQAEDRVLNFLKQNNRPYNVQVKIPLPSPTSASSQYGSKLFVLCATECM